MGRCGVIPKCSSDSGRVGAPTLARYLRRLPMLIVYALLIGWAIAELFPIVFMFYSSLKSHAEVVNNPLALPTELYFENYLEAWQGGAVGVPIGRYFGNSLLIVGISLVVVTLLAALGGYALSRYQLPGSGLMQSGLVVILAIPTHAVLIPVFLLLGNLNLRNNYLGLILVYSAFWLPFTLLMMRSYFDSFPSDLEDAAKIDGCSDLGVFWRIILPLSKGSIAGISIVNIVGMWSELLFAIVIMNQADMKTLTVGIMAFRGLYNTPWSVLMAGLAMSTLPTIIAFLLFQGRITKGMTVGAFR